MKKIFFFTLLTTGLLFSKTYEIVEPDALKQFQEATPKAIENFKRRKNKTLKKVENHTGTVLSKSTESKVTYIDPTYTLTRDIPRVDKFGNVIGVLYKKGISFNPLTYSTIKPPDFIIFNACLVQESKKVRELLETTYQRQAFMLVNAGCKSSDYVDNYFRDKTYFLSEEMKSKFKLSETISIVSVDLKIKRIKVEVIKTKD